MPLEMSLCFLEIFVLEFLKKRECVSLPIVKSWENNLKVQTFSMLNNV